MYNQAKGVFADHAGQLVAVSPEIPDSSLSMREKHDLGFEVLSDVGNRVARKFGIVYTLPEPMAQVFNERLDFSAYYGHDRNELPLAVTYVVDPERVIRYAFVDADYTKRAEPAEIVTVLENLEQQP